MVHVDEETVILRTLTDLVEPLAQIFPGDCEVVLHDLRKLPNSIVAITGNVTGRHVGDPATDRLLSDVASGCFDSTLGYASRNRDGATLRSTTLVFHTSQGVPVAALCVNNDTRIWHQMAELAKTMLPWAEAPENEQFPRDVEELASDMLGQAIADCGVPVELMKKKHKVAVVRDLRDRGFFTLREASETAAGALGVSRFSIYKYLNEIEAKTNAVGAGKAPTASG